MHDLFVFDLDNTLAKSKTVIDSEMSLLLKKLLEKKKVAVISGGGFTQFKKELLSPLSQDTNFSNLYLFPTDGTAFYSWNTEKKDWEKIYGESLTNEGKEKIKEAFKEVLSELKIDTNHIKGELIEDRDSAMTFSGLGQEAPLELKEKWDPDDKKRLEIKKLLEKRLEDFEIHIAGTTSIDITAKGLDKAYGIKKMIEYIKVPKEKMIFVGDSLFAGGNDNPVINTGIETISVKNPEETKEFIRKNI